MGDLSFSRSNKGGPILLHGGYSYTLQRSAANDDSVEYWHCTMRGQHCPGRGISRDYRLAFDDTTPHNHAPEAVDNEAREVRLDLKRKAADAIGGNNTTAILQNAISNCSEAVMAALPSSEHLKRIVQRSRNAAQVPIPLPHSLMDMDVTDEFKKTRNEENPEDFLLYDSGMSNHVDGGRILIFGTSSTTSFMRQCHSLLADGTFKVVPNLFYQLYTILGVRRPHDSNREPAVPVLWILMASKQECAYVHAFQKIADMLPDWSPHNIMLDFEKAAMNAFSRV